MFPQLSETQLKGIRYWAPGMGFLKNGFDFNMTP